MSFVPPPLSLSDSSWRLLSAALLIANAALRFVPRFGSSASPGFSLLRPLGGLSRSPTGTGPGHGPTAAPLPLLRARPPLHRGHGVPRGGVRPADPRALPPALQAEHGGHRAAAVVRLGRDHGHLRGADQLHGGRGREPHLLLAQPAGGRVLRGRAQPLLQELLPVRPGAARPPQRRPLPLHPGARPRHPADDGAGGVEEQTQRGHRLGMGFGHGAAEERPRGAEAPWHPRQPPPQAAVPN